MADHYYAADKGRELDATKITAGTSSSAAKHMELRTLDGAGLNNMDVLIFLDQLRAYFTKNTVTP